MRAMLVLVLVAGCGPAAPTSQTAAPLAAATDAADQQCRVILRDAADGLVDFDVATSLGAGGGMMLRADGGAWSSLDGLAIAGAPGWYQRWRVRLPDGASRVELVPYAAHPDGGRLFDHNRLAGDLDNYALSAPFAYADDGACLDHAQPRATLGFNADYSTTQRGELVRGGHLTVEYALARLSQCRSTHNGYRFWSLDASVKAFPSGVVSMGTVVASNGPTVYAVPFEAEIPDGTEHVELWFHNYSPGECDAWDSDYGRNYSFAVGDPLPKVGWAGDWGGSWSRDCVHTDGLADPLRLDEYARERACTFIDADAWVPGAADHPEWVQARVEYEKDGVPATAWLDLVGKVGNNARFRWTLPYEIHALTDWSTVTYRFAFSTDGNSFYRIGPRTILDSRM